MEDIAPGVEYLQQHGLRPVASNALIVVRALERGIHITCDRKRGIRLRANGRSATYKGGLTSLNSKLAISCVRQKDVTSRLLRRRGVPTPESAFFAAHDAERAWLWAKPILPVAVKPVGSSKGRSIFLRVSDRQTFVDSFNAVSSRYGGALVEEFIGGIEHRILVIDGNVVAATRRVPASVVGDGESTVQELVLRKNQARQERMDPIHLLLSLDDQARKELSRQGLRADSVPDVGSHVLLRSTSNIHTGGDAVDATDDLSADVRNMVEEAARALPGLRLGGFDVLLPSQMTDGPASILEVNDNPMISMHHFPWSGAPRDVASAVIDAMFPSSVLGPASVESPMAALSLRNNGRP